MPHSYTRQSQPAVLCPSAIGFSTPERAAPPKALLQKHPVERLYDPSNTRMCIRGPTAMDGMLRSAWPGSCGDIAMQDHAVHGVTKLPTLSKLRANHDRPYQG